MLDPLVSPDWLQRHLNDPDLVIADVRWYIDDKSGGREAFDRSRIPGAVFLDLDRDLSDQSDPKRGRHPLPDPNRFVEILAHKGIGRNTHVVAYDDRGGSIAVRLWWMMRWLGSSHAALLDGGFPKWKQSGFPIETGVPRIPKYSSLPFLPQTHAELAVERDRIESLDVSATVLADARAPERYRGDVEPVDFRAGHIPNAVNIPYSTTLTNDSAPVFRSPRELSNQFRQLGLHPNSNVICYCGSGVTACHLIFALNLAGVHNVRLYPGSWSEWIHYHS